MDCNVCADAIRVESKSRCAVDCTRVRSRLYNLSPERDAAQMLAALTIYQWTIALAAAAQLALGCTVLVRAQPGPLKLPFVALCISLFSWNLSSLAYRLTGHTEFYVLDHALSPLTLAAAFHFIVVFVGRRRKLASALALNYAFFGALSLASLLALVELNPLSDEAWASTFLAGIAVAVVVGAVLLTRHLRRADHDERRQTQRVLIALVGGMAIGSTELINNLGIEVPSLGAVGTLFAAVMLSPLAAQRSLGQAGGFSLVGVGTAALSVVLYLGVFELLGNNTLALVLGTTTLTLLITVVGRDWVARTTRHRAQRERLTWMGRMSDQLAHDLKNPLAAMRGAVQLLEEEKRRGHSLDDHAELIGLLDEQVIRMMRVIEKYRRLGSIKPEKRTFDIAGMVHDVVGLLQHGHDQTLIAKTSESRAVGDPELLAVALENLIVNAADASTSEGRIWVTANATSNEASIEVRDEGEGMDERTLESVFDEFFTTKAEGTGLGLAFVKRVMRQHGGDVDVQSRLGEGTRVRMHWPSGRGNHEWTRLGRRR